MIKRVGADNLHDTCRETKLVPFTGGIRTLGYCSGGMRERERDVDRGGGYALQWAPKDVDENPALQKLVYISILVGALQKT